MGVAFTYWCHRVHKKFKLREISINLPYSGKNWRALNLAKWRKKVVFLYWRNLNLAIWNCTCDVIIFTLWRNRSTSSLAYARSPKLTFQVDSCIQSYHVFESIWNPTTGEELNCVRERTNTEDSYAVAMIRRSAVVGHAPRNMSAACALFLRRRGTIWHDQLRLVLFNTRVQS